MNVDRATLLAAMREEHEFPGQYPFVVIARNTPDVYLRLLAAVEAEQDGHPFELSIRESSAKNYISYRLQIFVNDAEIALEKKMTLQGIPGVVMVL